MPLGAQAADSATVELWRPRLPPVAHQQRIEGRPSRTILQHPLLEAITAEDAGVGHQHTSSHTTRRRATVEQFALEVSSPRRRPDHGTGG